MSKILNLADLPKASLSEVHEAAVPKTDGGVVQFKLLSVTDLKEINKHRGEDFRFMIELVARSMVDADGKRIYGEEVLKSLWTLTGEVVKSLFEQMSEANNLTKKQADSIRKNSETASGETSSTSPSGSVE